jgi:hypothetical protein
MGVTKHRIDISITAEEDSNDAEDEYELPIILQSS